MWRIINYYVEGSRPERHGGVISYNGWTMSPLDVHSNYVAFAAAPKAAAVHGRIEDTFRRSPWIKGKQTLK